METVEIDLMQAQIGSLATDVSRLEAKVAKGGGSSSGGRVIVIPTTNVSVTADGATISAEFDNTTYNIPELFDAGNFVMISIIQDGIEARLYLNLKYTTDTVAGTNSYRTNDRNVVAVILTSQVNGSVTVKFITG